MKIPNGVWYFIGVSIVIISCGIVSRVSKSSVSVEVDNKIIKSRISLQLQQATSFVENATSTVQAAINNVPFLGTQTLSVEQWECKRNTSNKESLDIKKEELERV